MQNKNPKIMVEEVINCITKVMGKDVGTFMISNVDENPDHPQFRIVFKAYEYFWVGVDYERGSFGAFILNSEKIMSIKHLSTWWEKINLEEYIKELKEDIESRIPDKYLERKSWLKKSKWK